VRQSIVSVFVGERLVVKNVVVWVVRTKNQHQKNHYQKKKSAVNVLKASAKKSTASVFKMG